MLLWGARERLEPKFTRGESESPSFDGTASGRAAPQFLYDA
jgi:hypothetical protein